MYEQIARNKRLAVVYIGLFFFVWIGIGAIVGVVWGALSGPTETGSTAVGRQALDSTTLGDDAIAGALIAAIAAAAAIAFSQWRGSQLVLTTAGAVPADPERYRQLHNIVEALAIGGGIPVPSVYVIEDPSPNAFATGMAPDRAAVTVTTGLLEQMNRQELEGVMAHELSHIKNYDIRLLLVVTTLIGLAGLLAGLAFRLALSGEQPGSASWTADDGHRRRRHPARHRGVPLRSPGPARPFAAPRVPGRRQRSRAHPQPGGAHCCPRKTSGQ